MLDSAQSSDMVCAKAWMGNVGHSYFKVCIFFVSSRRRHTRFDCDWSSDVCSSDLDRMERRRIGSLAIPPAWTDVWICPDPLGHIQATARDAKGRKQYRYHARFRALRDESKFGRMLTFCEALPRLREQIERDLAPPGLSRRKLLATLVRLLDKTLIRVGNDEYTKANRSYGLTTLRRRHVAVKGNTVRFEFRGKSGVQHSVAFTDRRLAGIVQQLQDQPGQQLFKYVDAE